MFTPRLLLQELKRRLATPHHFHDSHLGMEDLHFIANHKYRPTYFPAPQMQNVRGLAMEVRGIGNTDLFDTEGISLATLRKVPGLHLQSLTPDNS
jgi:hypothetical protein